jgi:hypothetical protein
MLPILISRGSSLPLILKLLFTKLIIGVAAGFLVDITIRFLQRKQKIAPQEASIEELCERENCRCGEHFALSALRHTLYITVFIFFFSLALNLIIHGVGEEKLGLLLSDRPIIGNLLAAVVGLIPNCASSLVLTELYLSDILSVGSLLSGLLVNAGVGIAILFRNNRPIKDSLRLVLLLWLIGTLSGILIDLTPLHTFF